MLRFFRRREKGHLRHGVWIAPSDARGIFIHGDRDEIQYSRWTLAELTTISDVSSRAIASPLTFSIDEVSEMQALAEINTNSATGLLADILDWIAKHGGRTEARSVV